MALRESRAMPSLSLSSPAECIWGSQTHAEPCVRQGSYFFQDWIYGDSTGNFPGAHAQLQLVRMAPVFPFCSRPEHQTYRVAIMRRFHEPCGPYSVRAHSEA